jgi:hypothetical protein
MLHHLCFRAQMMEETGSSSVRKTVSHKAAEGARREPGNRAVIYPEPVVEVIITGLPTFDFPTWNTTRHDLLSVL